MAPNIPACNGYQQECSRAIMAARWNIVGLELLLARTLLGCHGNEEKKVVMVNMVLS